jgi:drug/metabolite transporter (DMT)-like permease
LALAQLRLLGTAVIYLIPFLARGRMRPWPLSQRKSLLLIAAAAVSIALNQLTFIGGMARTNVAHTGLIVAAGPVAVLAIAVAMHEEVLTGWKIGGTLVAFAGVGILTVDKAGQGTAGYWLGDLIVLVSTLVFAVYTVAVKEMTTECDVLTLNTFIFVPAAVMMLPFCGHSVALTNWPALTLDAWWGLGFLILLGSVVSYLLFAYVMTDLAASRASAFIYLQPLIAIALGIWLLSERLTSKVLIGGGLILVGVYLAEREWGEEKR